MDAYVSNTTFDEIAGRLRAAGRIAILTHERPDGDALGSALALARAAASLGTAADVYLAGPLEPALETLIRDTPVHRAENGLPSEEPDVVVVVDTGAWTQLGPLADWVRARSEKTIVVDHHPHGDDVGTARIIDTSAGAAAQMVLALLDAAGYAIESAPDGTAVAEALFVGVATDTGWFRYPNATPDTLRVAARLLDTGVDKGALFELIEETFRPERLALEARALASVEYAGGGIIAIQSLRHHDFVETGGTVNDLTGLVNGPMRVAGVRVAILLAETTPGLTKISLRAKEARGADERLARLADVGEVARRLGGGGHKSAAGVRVSADLDAARVALLEAVETQVGAPGA